MIFRTSEDEKYRNYEIAVQMRKAGVSIPFIVGCVELASVDQGIHELMTLWSEEAGVGDIKEKELTLAALWDAMPGIGGPFEDSQG